MVCHYSNSLNIFVKFQNSKTHQQKKIVETLYLKNQKDNDNDINNFDKSEPLLLFKWIKFLFFVDSGEDCWRIGVNYLRIEFDNFPFLCWIIILKFLLILSPMPRYVNKPICWRNLQKSISTSRMNTPYFSYQKKNMNLLSFASRKKKK